MTPLNGKELAQSLIPNFSYVVKKLRDMYIVPKLAVVLIGDDPASKIYVNAKKALASKCDIETDIHLLPIATTFAELKSLISTLNNDEKTTGIIIQLPLPKHIDTQEVLNLIDHKKDVDGFAAHNIGLLHSATIKIDENLYLNELSALLDFDLNSKYISNYFVPATALGVMILLESYGVKFKGQNVVLLGSSNIVGRPLEALFLNAGSSTTICNIYTKDIKKLSKNADILCVAIGQANMIDESYIKEGAIVVDVGINRVEGKIFGDCNYSKIQSHCEFVTPVPGGVGPMTIISLLANVIKASILKIKDR